MILSALVGQLETIPDLDGHVALTINVEEALKREPPALPYAWIVEPRGASGQSRTRNILTQAREQRFGILTVVEGDADDVTGASAMDASETLRGIGATTPGADTVLGALLGAVLISGQGSIEHARDGLVQWADGRLYWLDEFRFTHTLRSRA